MPDGEGDRTMSEMTDLVSALSAMGPVCDRLARLEAALRSHTIALLLTVRDVETDGDAEQLAVDHERVLYALLLENARRIVSSPQPAASKSPSGF